jgi:hypothetical protein
VNETVWVVEYKTLDNIAQGGWTRNDIYPGDEYGARDDYRILKQVFVHVRIGKRVSKIEWEDE